LLKETLGGQAIYIPAGVQLQHRVGTICGSAGELQAEDLCAALKENPPCLLLDEWDAHLDDERATELSSQIDSYVKRGGVVVEIRHRRIQSPD
jgi:ABC-type protease/lipase transport system fused ATPase/permease subunit